MSREDKISKLFIDNQHKLDEYPGNDLWSKIESKLDRTSVEAVDEPLVSANTSLQAGKGRLMKFLPYIAAAASLMLFILVLPLLRNNKSISEEIAEKSDNVEDVVLPEISEAFPANESDKDSAFELKEREQKEKLLESAKKAASDNKKAEAIIEKYGLDRIEMNAESEDLIIISLEPSPEDEKSFVAKPQFEFNDNITATGNAANTSPIVSRTEYQNDGRPYANPPSANTIMADDIGIIAQKQSSPETKKEKATKPLIKSKSTKKENEQKLYGPMKNFQWILGNWTDEEQGGGKSNESWRWLNQYSIEGSGSRIMDKNKIFEEKLTIFYDPSLNQVFLKMPIDDYKNTALYMMTALDTERIVFEQKENQSLPNKVIFQRNLNGFSTIINFDNGILNPTQQAYLQQRNRVSNTRALRILTPADK